MNDPVVVWATSFVYERMRGKEPSQMADGVRQVCLVLGLFPALANGGIDAWLTNTDGGEYAVETVEALREVGALRAAALVEQALSVFPRGRPSKRHDTRDEQVERLGMDIREGVWGRIEDQLLSSDEDIEPLLKRYVLQHAAAFHLSEMPSA